MGHACRCLDWIIQISIVAPECRDTWGRGLGRDPLTFEDGLWLCGERQRGFEWILHAMFSKNLKKLGGGGIRINHGVGIRNLYTESVRGEVFAILGGQRDVSTPALFECYRTPCKQTLWSKVFNNEETFLSVASAREISTVSASSLPSLSRKRALMEPATVVDVTSCWICERSKRSRFCLFEGGGTTVAIL